MFDWQTIVAEHGPAVWRTIYRLLNHHADALDCYQETFLNAYRVAAEQPIGHWHAFLTHLATRRAIDRLRQRLRQRQRFTALDQVPEPSTDRDSPVQQAQESEQLARLRTTLALLPDKQAEVFWLSCVEGLPHAAISVQLQLSAGEVRVLLHRARARLRAALEPHLLDGRNTHD